LNAKVGSRLADFGIHLLSQDESTANPKMDDKQIATAFQIVMKDFWVNLFYAPPHFG